MSDTADKQSKTFDPTPRRLRQARDEGQVAKSSEVATAGVVLAAGVAMIATGKGVVVALTRGARAAFERSSEAAVDIGATGEVLSETLSSVGLALIPFVFLVLVAAVLCHVGQTGFMLSPKALAPKFSRINPFSRIKEVLGPVPAGMRMLVALLKMAFVGMVVFAVASGEIEDVQLAASRGANSMLMRLGASVIRVFLAAGVALCIIALIDFAYQKNRHITNLKMTRDEVKRENREEDGAPELKNRRKHMHRELTLNRVLEEVPKADVIVTNPTHFAVALRYEAGRDVAPRVVAKGVDALALTIRKIARKHTVPIVENRPLARALWRKVKVGRPVPTEHFQAVAQVLAHVYRIKQRLAASQQPGRGGSA